jgi:caffeoyl-CoA O-methyltransferase
VIVADNVIRRGAVLDATSPEPAVQAIQQFNAALAADPRVTATIMQTVGVKGLDGMAIAVVNR